jgi:hypothetical protein
MFLETATNLDITDNFHVLRRNGKISVDDGCHSIFNAGPYKIGVRDGYIVPVESGLTLSDVGGSGQGKFSYPMAYVRLGSLVYCSDGSSRAVVDTVKGLVRSWGLDSPSAPLVFRNDVADSGVALDTSAYAESLGGTLSAGANDGMGADGFGEAARGASWTAPKVGGRGLAGNRMVIATYVRSDGQESGASDPISLMCSELTESITINVVPSDDPDVTAVKFYVSTPGGDQTYFVGSASNVPVSGPYVNFEFDTTQPNQNYRPLMMDALAPPIAGDQMDYYNTKIGIVTGKIVMFTLGGAYELMSLTDYVVSPGGLITMFATVDNGFWLGTDKEIWFYQGDNQPYKAVKRADYGVFYRSAAKKFGLWAGDSPSTYIVAETSKGAVRLGNSGDLQPLTEKTHHPINTNFAAAVIADDRGYPRYIGAYSLDGQQTAQGIYN